jgi:hypothetical protein
MIWVFCVRSGLLGSYRDARVLHTLEAEFLHKTGKNNQDQEDMSAITKIKHRYIGSNGMSG